MACAALGSRAAVRPAARPAAAPRARARAPRRAAPRCEMDSATRLAREGKIRVVQPQEAAELLQAPGWRHLDVRPAYERERAHVEGSLHVPLFVEDESSDPVSLVKKAVTFGYGGWWMGNKLTRRNNQFMEQAAEALGRNGGKGANEGVVVACGEGLRSLLAAEALYVSGGFGEVAWLPQGYNGDRGDALPSSTDTAVKDAGSGAVSGAVLKLGKSLGAK